MNTLPISDNRHPYGRALAIPQVAVAITSHLPGELCSYLGFESENSRLFPRGTLIIDPDGVLRARAINTGASAEPTLRSRRDAGDVIKREQRNDEEAWDCRASRMRA
jgi:alkyl hydroperoxide reductase subunit AhpC